MIQTKTQRKHLYTPLRYPGGKTSLFEFFSQVIEQHQWKNVTYIEPYAGGAGAALSLLFLGKVDKIVINDYDKAIYSFWKSITDETEAFLERLANTPVTVAEWERQKIIYKNNDASDPLALGFAFFFLNRSNRSGILNAGPIGGKDQTGAWKIDARYNKKALAEKIRLIGENRNKITILNRDGVDVINDYAKDKNAFFYVDPPYFVKGAELYLNAFKYDDHSKLALMLNEHKDTRWILTYDNEPEILELYHGREYRPFNLKYSAHHNSPLGSELMIFSDEIDVDKVDSL